jgi:hypothetical protein
MGNRLESLCSLLPENPSQGAEIGVHKGAMSVALLQRYPDLFLYMIDHWKAVDPQSEYAKTGDAMAGFSASRQQAHMMISRDVTAFANDRRAVIQMDCLDAANEFKDESLDFVFLDADHSYSGTLAAIRTWIPKVRIGGAVTGHDYANKGHIAGVFRAVNEIQGIIKCALILGGNTMWGFTRT